MKTREFIGLVITIAAIALLIYELFYVNLTRGSIGVRGTISSDSVLVSAGFLLILVGPWLWFGEVPVAVKKFIEAKTGRKL
ncbi:MAG: hypothetical protein RMH84_03110 [Sulfolobales archaeon]|nr:hypothetical protein [Sulfolobales archaeon]MCX8208676.1 hypothetical protein [Sulfolobales archaeon]MDW8010566.1 hypothetical protein [Sulfolobales archaeon]